MCGLNFVGRSTQLVIEFPNFSASDSFSTMALYKSIYLLTYLLNKLKHHIGRSSLTVARR